MKTKFNISSLFLLISMIVISCSPQASQPAQQKNSDENKEVTQSTSQAGNSGQISQPSSINLKDVPTSETSGDAKNTVIPAPGERDPEAKLIHNISLDLSNRLGIDISQIQLIEISSVSWNDTSLGCPEEGLEYTQEVIDGYKVILLANDKEYIYHSNGLTSFILCGQGN